MATNKIVAAASAFLLLLLLLLTPPTPAAAAELQRYQCPQLGQQNCTANDGLAFFDGCKAIACIGWRSAVTNPRRCQMAASPAELARCERLNERLTSVRTSTGARRETLVNCPQFTGIDFCAKADMFFSYHDGCNYHLCDGSGGALQRTSNTCPDAAVPSDLFFCSSSFYSVARQHTAKYACSAQTNNADRICKLMWPGYRFGDACFGGADFVCGPGGSVMVRPPPRLCPLLDASQSLKCREVSLEVANLLSESRGFTCPELHYRAVCSAENRGFVYNDGCNSVLCDGEEAGMTEGRVCKLPLHESQVAGREFCTRRAADVRRRLAASRRHTVPCMTPEQACAGPDPEGETYFDGCQHCTCLGRGRAQCTRRSCDYFFGTDDEFAAFCRVAAYKLPRL